MKKITEFEAYKQYDEMLDELYPLEGIACNAFSTLLLCGDPIAYECGFSDWCDAEGIELED
jgi:hypothetical protein